MTEEKDRPREGEGKTKQSVYLIDGNSYVYRAFFATPHLSNSKGVPTNATYAFLSMVKKLINERSPDSLVVVFDSKAPSFREEISREYKAQRPPMPGNMAVQFPYIKALMSAMGIATIEKEGFEADDIIATLVERLTKTDREIYIVTNDKDMTQLVSPNVFLYDAQKDIVIDEDGVKNRLGIEPCQVQDYLALAGDTSDNIPGVPGIGGKTARELIGAFGSVDEIYRNLDGITKTSVRNKLVNGKGSAEMSKKLSLLVRDVPIEEFDEITRKGHEDTQELRKLLRELEFTSLYREISAEITSPGNNYGLCEVSALSMESIALLASYSGNNARNFHPVAFAAFDGEKICYSSVSEDLKEILSTAKEIVTHNLKPLLSFAKQENIAIGARIFDTMLSSYLINPLKKDYGIDNLLSEYLDIHIPASEVADILKSGAPYLPALKDSLLSSMGDLGLTVLYFSIELPLVEVLADMEYTGVKVDRKMLQDLSRDYDKRLNGIAREIYTLSGEPFNINSPQQLSRILFDVLKLPPVKKTKTGYSTDTEVLQRLSGQHGLPARILEYRTLAKLKSTYIDVLPTLINQNTGRIHTTYNQMIVATGRLSSSDPNLQNIPIRGEEGRKIRKAFIAEENHLLISSDYSQIELRVLAHFSKDALLIDTFLKDEDIHTRVAREVFGVPPEGVTQDMRRTAKVINFGIIYGMSGFGLAKELGVSQKEAQQYINDYFAKHQGVKSLLEGIIEDARERGFVRTLSGRIRQIPELNNPENTIRQLGERAAMNMPIQGTAADVIKVAMVNIYREIEKRGLTSKLIMQIHDELVFEAKEDEREIMEKLIVEKMENAIPLSVPLKVSIGQGKNWAEAHE